jgi:8-oxo-dGTP pyrophosphatase MutT (NUDIX family)
MPDLRDLLIERLRSRLPGRKAQARFAPDLGFGRHFAEPPADGRRAAVIALLYHTQEPPIAPESALIQWRIPLLVRPEHLEHHAGQVALPGGMIEEGESSGQAALRELHEELGVPGTGIELLGELSPLYVFASDNFVVPWVAIASFEPTFILNVDEASAVIEFPVTHLNEESHIGLEIREQNGVRFHAPFFRCGSHHIWGATAMILAELATILAAADAAASLDC